MPSFSEPVEVRQVWTSDQGSMAQETAKERWPRITQGMVEDVEKTASSFPVQSAEQIEGTQVAKLLQDLKQEIEGDQQLRPFSKEERPDYVEYNKQLEQIGSCSWLACPWLFGECYLYRHVKSIFLSTKHWQNYDPFKAQKDSTFVKSRTAVEELATRYASIRENAHLSKDLSPDAQKLLFIEMTEVALWGNATDLSLLSNIGLDELQSMQGKAAIAKSQRNIIDNGVEEVWDYLQVASKSLDLVVDVVLDNAGFEFFTDVLYSTYLLDSGIASKIIFHVKDIPWFVSDVTPPDVDSLLEHLESTEAFPNQDGLDDLLKHFRLRLQTGEILVKEHDFWTRGCSFHEMPGQAPDLLSHLEKSNLVIFKGDLNYRKLTKDGLWPHITPFKTALGPLGANSGLKIFALRTNKADVCVGVPNEKKVKQLDQESPNKAWVRNGKYGVLSFSSGE